MSCRRTPWSFALRIAIAGGGALGPCIFGGCESTPDANANGPESGVTTFCTGSPGLSCGDLPEGTKCPGEPTVCTQCAPGVFVQTESQCQCTSGTWACSAPEAGTVTCLNPLPETGQFFSNLVCSLPYGGDSGSDAAEAGSDAAEAGSDAAEAGSDAAEAD
jgi:hypothetical protein